MPLGFAPVVVPSPDPVSLAVTIGSTIASVASSIFGFGAPRGNYQKFDREMAPKLRGIMQQTGMPAVCLWFGEVVGIDTAGQRFVLGSAATNDIGEATIQAEVDRVGQQIAAIWYDAVRIFSPRAGTVPTNPPPGGVLQQPTSTVGYSPTYTTQPALSQSGFAAGFDNPSTLLLLGAAAVLLFSYSRGKK